MTHSELCRPICLQQYLKVSGMPISISSYVPLEKQLTARLDIYFRSLLPLLCQILQRDHMQVSDTNQTPRFTINAINSLFFT